MANVLNRITKEYLLSQKTPNFPIADWIHNPVIPDDAQPFPSIYWNIAGDVVTLQTPGERAITDDDNFIATLNIAEGETELFGDGPDGDLVFAVDTTLTRDIYAQRLEVSPGVALTTAGYRVFANRGIVNLGTIRNNGQNAVADAAGTGTTAGTMAGGGAGAAGGNGAGANSDALNTDNIPGQGGRGGNGGDGGAGSGGTSGQIRSQNNSRVRARRFENISLMGDLDFALMGDLVRFAGGSGGAAGAGSGGGNLGGGGGEGGGNVLLVALFIFNGPGATIEARGGNGGDAPGTNSGGGGGGGGGVIASITSSFRDRGVRDVTEGLGGAGSGTGTNGVDGNSGRLINLRVR